MNARAWTVLWVVLLASLAMLAALPAEQLGAIGLRGAQALFWLGLVSLVAEAAALNFRLGSTQQATASLAYLPFLTAAVLFPPLPTALTIGVVVALSNTFIRQKPLHVVLFNVGQAIVAVGLGGIAYHSIVTAVGATSLGHIIAFVALALIFFSTNLALMSVMVASIKNESTVSILREIAGPRASNLLYDLLASPIAIVPALMYESYVAGVFIIVFPLVLLRYSYATKFQLEAANEDLLGVLVTTIETRDPYTSGHSQRVAKLAAHISRDLNLSRKKMRMVERAALLHDIGKIDAQYSALIAKPHDLTEEERNIIQTHPEKGAELLQTLSQVHAEVVDSVRHHHERFDGRGYPAGLVGLNIPLAARIIMVCDAVDAMLSDRPYRNALPIAAVKDELRRCAGAQFDPDIIQAVLNGSLLRTAKELVEDKRPERGTLKVLAS